MSTEHTENVFSPTEQRPHEQTMARLQSMPIGDYVVFHKWHGACYINIDATVLTRRNRNTAADYEERKSKRERDAWLRNKRGRLGR